MRKRRFSEEVRIQRQREIQDKALSVFSTHGCFNTTLDEIARRVGVAKGTLYLHYPSVEALLTDALNAGVQKLQERLGDLSTREVTTAAGFRTVIRILVQMNHEGHASSVESLSRLQCSVKWKDGAPREEERRRLEEVLMPLVDAWKASALVDKTFDSSWVAAVILALTSIPSVFGRTLDPMGGDQQRAIQESEERSDWIAELLLRGLAPKGRLRARRNQSTGGPRKRIGRTLI